MTRSLQTSCDNIEAIEELKTRIDGVQNALSALSAEEENALSPALSKIVARFEG